ncbi:hypothetical protein C0993_012318 [Termitomyces sp. T159_Od127]|nr:hypothetical protein C0993_012318 [Termitomyces sp. T159_Od127]
MARHALQYAPPGQLARYISNKRILPPQARGNPWLEDGNIILITERKAFKFHKRTLTSQSLEFEKRIGLMNDGNTDVVEGCPVLEVPFASPTDLEHFLTALHALETHSFSGFSLATRDGFRALEGTLRVATLTKTSALRTRAIAALQERYPTTLAGWDIVRPSRYLPSPPPFPDEEQEDWEWDRALIINLAREVGAFSILPAAMAMLTNDCSAGEVFGVRLPPPTEPASPPMSPMSPMTPSPFSPISPSPPERTRLNDSDGPSFALLKEHNHLSIVSLLLSIRSLGSSCNRPPEVIPRKAGRAPVGSSLLLPGPSQCSGFFKETAARLLEVQVLENPVGYAQFVCNVLVVRQDPERTCKFCWREFVKKCKEAREQWWEELPRKLGFVQGWADERLKSVELGP